MTNKLNPNITFGSIPDIEDLDVPDNLSDIKIPECIKKSNVYPEKPIKSNSKILF